MNDTQPRTRGWWSTWFSTAAPRHVLVASGWRLLALLVAGGLFHLLISLTEWQRTFVPSLAWLEVLSQRASTKDETEWVPALSQAVREMVAEQEKVATTRESQEGHRSTSSASATDSGATKGPQVASDDASQRAGARVAPIGYPSADVFFEAVKAKLESIPSNQVWDEARPAVEKLGSAKKRLADLRSTQASRREKLVEDLGALKSRLEVQEKAVEKAATDFEVATLFPTPGTDAGIERSRARLSERRATLAGRRQSIIDYLAQRNIEDARIASEVAELEMQVEKAEKALRHTFDLASASARPVAKAHDPLIEARTALRIGDEGDPWHILYVVTWYGIEGAIAFLVCLVLVPWLLRLGAGSSDPAEIRSTITSRLKGWLEKTLGGTAANLLLTSVAATAVAGATAAATPRDSWPTAEVLLAPGASTRAEPGDPRAQRGSGLPGQDGGKGDPGRTGDPGRAGDPGEAGSPGRSRTGEGGACGDGCSTISTQLTQIQLLYRETYNLWPAAPTPSGEVVVIYRDPGVTQTPPCAGCKSGNRGHEDRSEGEIIAARLSGIEDGIARISRESKDRAMRLQTRTEAILELQRATQAEAASIKPIAADLLRLSAAPRSRILRWILHRRYKVDAVAESILERGLVGEGSEEDAVAQGDVAVESRTNPTPSAAEDRTALRSALHRMKEADLQEMSAAEFKEKLEAEIGQGTRPSLRKLVEDTMPFIYWACRTPKSEGDADE